MYNSRRDPKDSQATTRISQKLATWCVGLFLGIAPGAMAENYDADWTAYTYGGGAITIVRSVGDLNADGVTDVAWCQAGGNEQLALIDGSNGNVLATLDVAESAQYGTDVAGLQYVVGNDTTRLIIVGAPWLMRWKNPIGCCPRYRGGLYVYEYSNNSLTFLYRIVGEAGNSGTCSADSVDDIGHRIVAADFDGDGVSDADWDGDGYPDLAVARARADFAGLRHSVVIVSGAELFTLAATPPASDVEIDDGPLLTQLKNANAGPYLANYHNLAWVDDFQDDDSVGVLVGNDNLSQTGTRYVWWFKNNDGAADITWTVPASDDTVRFGRSVAMIGDINNDGINDIAIGDDKIATNSTSVGAGAGNVYIYLGGGSQAPSQSLADAYVKLDPEAGYDIDGVRFGWHVQGLGDIDGDGIDDFCVVSRKQSTVQTRIYVYRGITDLTSPPDGIDDADGRNIIDYYTVLDKQSDCDGYYTSVWAYWLAGVGDLNGDSYSDIAVLGKSSGNCGPSPNTNCAMAYFLSPDADGNGVMDIQQVGYTAAGTSVSTTLSNGWELTFDNVSAPGLTYDALEDPCSQSLGDLRVVPSTSVACVDLSSMASYSGNIQICAPYDEADVFGSETQVKLYHWNGASWEDATISVDIVNNIVCGVVTALSPFVIGEGCCVGLAGNVDGDGVDEINIADVTYLVTYAFKNGPAPPCVDEGNINGIGNIDISDVTALVSYMFKNGPDPAACP